MLIVNRTKLQQIVAIVLLALSARLGAEPPPRQQTSAQTLAQRQLLGSILFRDADLSSDRKIACTGCHEPQHAFADPRPYSAGSGGIRGMRNAPSLIGVASRPLLFWDGRRSRLTEAVMDPFFNPAEMGLPTEQDLLDRVAAEPALMVRFKLAFPEARSVPTLEQVSSALATYLLTLRGETSAYDAYRSSGFGMSEEAQLGLRLFEGKAACSVCHSTEGAHPKLTDNSFRHSGVGQQATSLDLPTLVRLVVDEDLSGRALGARVLTQFDWSTLGRFAVTHAPPDVGSFRVPSLRNVAVTAPYMHDGSIPTLPQVVDHEIYYRGLNTGHPVNLTQRERDAIVAFLGALTDRNGAARGN